MPIITKDAHHGPPCSGCGAIVPNPHHRIHVDAAAQLIVRGKLTTNYDWWDGATMTRIQLDGKSCLEIVGRVELYYDADILCCPGSYLAWRSGWANRGLRIRCARRITIGDDVAFGPDLTILDSDFHQISGQPSMTQPVHIGNHVWISSRCMVLKGVTIGDGAVVGAGSVVTRHVPAGCLVAGNPARVIREGVTWR